jgi:hypothetical protein
VDVVQNLISPWVNRSFGKPKPDDLARLRNPNRVFFVAYDVISSECIRMDGGINGK